ncbi:electron transfer flavoprotein subunit beta/FixA family protein [Vibrio ostreicida]|uniref:Electron transfer flavoprotein subunit beta n=1 Tax=Vibrio ostreicida TaxID=526588 RepID=A0ABT8BX24_9VIBR|nr:electron transfer flavoprotein subunit beta/FixA family protein [Vibrio ostreicida]MDN3611747.1 electron transfer flavoprotein subunit beta/FixA family protein [Vibrio ostreicida]NPD09561.1 electron transfer flavoprotein subunit beta/FixA family protein [Vibrio ostreicida]
MKVIVAIKRVIDPYVKVRVKHDGSGVETNNVKMSMNPFCEIAVEEAVRMKESGHANEVIAVSIGDASCQENLRGALALGADKAIHIKTSEIPEPLAVAKLLTALWSKEQPGLVLLGKQSIDSDNNQVAQMLAALTGRPQGTFASIIELEGEQVLVTREVDGGLETLALELPAIVSTDLRLNEPRYASLPNIMKAKKKPLEVLEPEDLGIDVVFSQQILEVMAPAERSGGEMLSSVSELVETLKSQAEIG